MPTSLHCYTHDSGDYPLLASDLISDAAPILLVTMHIYSAGCHASYLLTRAPVACSRPDTQSLCNEVTSRQESRVAGTHSC